MTVVVFPTLDEQDPASQGTLETWLVTDGTTVRAGQVVAEVRVTSTSGHIAVPAKGVLRLGVREGASVRQGSVVAHLE